MVVLLNQRLNRWLGPRLLRSGLKLRGSLIAISRNFLPRQGRGGAHGPIGVDSLLLLPFAMKLISIEVHDEIMAFRKQQQVANAAKKQQRATCHEVSILEAYVRPAIIPNDQWSNIQQSLVQFYPQFLKWVRTEFLLAKYRNELSYIASTNLLPPHFLQFQTSSFAKSSSESSGQETIPLRQQLPSSSHVRRAFDLDDWPDRKDFAATSKSMQTILKIHKETLQGGDLVKIDPQGVLRFVDLPSEAALSDLSLEELLELIGGHVMTCGTLNAFCERHDIYQLWTYEYIQLLGDYLLRRTQSYTEKYGSEKSNVETIVVDVGAGDGLLTHCLGLYFEEKLSSKPTNPSEVASSALTPKLVAVDDGSWSISAKATVKKMNVEDAMQRYGHVDTDRRNDEEKRTLRRQVIVLCSWMPMNEDWTTHFHAAKVDEYILIGECDDGQCGDNFLTWGNKNLFFLYDDAEDSESSPLQASGDDTQPRTSSPVRRPYEVAGYRRKDLDRLAKHQFSRFDCKVSKMGRTVSFRRRA